MIKAVIFDMDGVIFDSERISFKIWMKLLEENGLVPNSEFVYTIRGRNSHDAEEIFYNFYPNTQVDYKTLRKCKNEILRSELLSKPIPLKKGIMNILNYLKDNNIKMALASSTQTAYVKEYLTKENMIDYFHYIIGGDLVTHSKPCPMIFNLAQEALGVNKEDSIIIEDSKAGIYAALNGGFRSIWIPDELFYPDVREKTTYFANDLDEAITIIDKENYCDVLVKSFEAKVILADDFIKNAYLHIKRSVDKHYLLESNLYNSTSYIHNGNKLISLTMKKNRLYVYLALKDIDVDNKYTFNESKYRKYESTPILVKVYDESGLKICMNLLEELYKQYNILEGFDFFDEESMFLRYLKRPIDVLLSEGLVHYERQLRSKYNNGLYDDKVNVKFNVLVTSTKDIANLYISGNILELGNWNLYHSVKMEKVNENLFTLDIRLPKGYFEFKITNEKDWNGVEKGIWKEEISNHTYNLTKDAIIEDVIYNFNNR